MFSFYIFDLSAGLASTFCVSMKPDSEAMICDNSMSFLSKDTRIMTNIIWTLAATSLPTTGNYEMIRLASTCGGTSVY
jgi:hypothetical protein